MFKRLLFLLLLPCLSWGQIMPLNPLGLVLYGGKRDTTAKHASNYGKDHYVAPWGNDSWSGNRTDSARLTIASAQALLTGGDHRVLLRSGGEWREQFNVPTSGTSGHPITVTSYGSGAKPILNAADLMTGFTNPTGLNPDQSPATNLLLWLKADALTGLSDGDSVSTWYDSSAHGYNATQVSNTLKRPYYKTNILNGKPVLRFNGTSNYLVVNSHVADSLAGSDKPHTVFIVSATTTSDRQNTVWSLGNSGTANQNEILGTTDAATGFWRFERRDDAAGAQVDLQEGASNTNWHVFAWVFTGTTAALYVDGTQSGTTDAADVGTFTPNLCSIGALVRTTISNYHVGDIAEVIVYNSAVGSTDRGNLETYLKVKYAIGATSVPANTWAKTGVTTRPYLVLFDGVLGKVADSLAVDTGTGYWYWTGNTLYVHSTSDPATAFTNPGIEVSQRDQGLAVSGGGGRSYITVDGIECRNGNLNGINADNSPTNLTVKNSTIRYFGRDGIYLGSGATSAAISNCTIAGGTSLWYARYAVSGNGAQNMSVITSDISFADVGILAISDGSNNLDGITVSHNTIHDISDINLAVSADAQGVEFVGQTKKWVRGIISYNHVYNCAGAGLGPMGVSGTQVYENVVDSCGVLKHNAGGTNEPGIAIWGSNAGGGSHGTTVYNNTIHACYDGIQMFDSVFTTTIKNNIVSSSTRYGIYAAAGGGGVNSTTEDYNDVYASGTADFQGLSAGVHSIITNPLFVTAGSNFFLQASSPCKDTGVNVGLTLDFLSYPLPYNALFDIGAYEYHP